MSDPCRTGGNPSVPTSRTYPQIIEEVTRSGIITQEELGRAVGASLRTVQNWASGTSAPRGVKMKRLLDVQYLVDELRAVYTDQGIQIWLNSRNRNLSGQRPIDLLLDGQTDDVVQEAHRLSGAM